MKRSAVLFAFAFILARSALAAEPDTRSPYDTNPKCAERTTSASDPECTVQTEGTPRQTYPPGKAPIVAPPPAPAPRPTPRASIRDSGQPGSGATE